MRKQPRELKFPAFGRYFTLAVPDDAPATGSPTPESPAEWEPYTIFEYEGRTVGLVLFAMYVPYEVDLRDVLRLCAQRLGVRGERLTGQPDTIGAVTLDGRVDGMPCHLAVVANGPVIASCLQVEKAPSDWDYAGLLRPAPPIAPWREPLATWDGEEMRFAYPESWSARPSTGSPQAVDVRLIRGDAIACYLQVALTREEHRSHKEALEAVVDRASAGGVAIETLVPLSEDFRLARARAVVAGKAVEALFFADRDSGLSAIALLPTPDDDPYLWMRGRRAFDLIRQSAARL